jgi:uncharacterized protein (DUF488 family)
METKTKELLLEMENANNKAKLIEILNDCHSFLKSKLIDEGLKFYSEDSQFSESIIGEQTIKGKDKVNLMKSYEEINYIKDIIKGKIYTMSIYSEPN